VVGCIAFTKATYVDVSTFSFSTLLLASSVQPKPEMLQARKAHNSLGGPFRMSYVIMCMIS
jgi:hypothetical protein